MMYKKLHDKFSTNRSNGILTSFHSMTHSSSACHKKIKTDDDSKVQGNRSQ